MIKFSMHVWRRIAMMGVITALGASSLWAALDAPTESRVRVLSEYLREGNYTQIILQNFEIPEPIGVPLRNLPVIAQIEYGHAAAERAKSGSGKDFIAALTHLVASRNEAAAHDSALKDVLAFPAPDVRLAFARGPPPVQATMPIALREQVIALSEYCGASSLGSVHSVLVTHLGLDRDKAYEILASSRNQEEAFISAFEALPNDQARKAKLTELTRAIHRQNVAIAFEPMLASILRDGGSSGNAEAPQSRSPSGKGGPPTGANPVRVEPADGGPGSGGAGLVRGLGLINGNGGVAPGSEFPLVPKPASKEAAIKRYSTFVSENYGGGGSGGSGSGGGGGGGSGGGGGRSRTSFKTMTRSAKGFGGIVFGNKVSTAAGAPRPVSVEYQKGTTKLGALKFSFGNGSSALLPGVTAECIHAAHEMVYAPSPGIDPIKEGDGAGMVGIYDNFPWIARHSGEFASASRFNVVLHPAVANKALGWAFVRVDAMPIERTLFRELSHSQANLQTVAALEQLWDTLKRVDSLGTWKMIDVPLEVEVRTDSVPWRIVPMRASDESSPKYPLGLRQTAFLDMHHFLFQDETKETAVDPDVSETFYRLLPSVIQVSQDYAEVNNFARVLGALRWAKEAGATFATDTLPTPPEPVRTPLGIEVSQFGVFATNEVSVVTKLLLGVGVLLLVVNTICLLPLIFYCRTIRKVLMRCSPENRAPNPKKVWLLLIPGLNVLWHFVLVVKLAASIGTELKKRGIIAARRPGRVVGLAMCVFVICSVPVSLLNLVFAFLAFFCWIIHWIKIARVSRKIAKVSREPIPPVIPEMTMPKFSPA